MKAISRRDFLKQCAGCACGLAAWGVLPGFSSQAFAQGNGNKLLLVNLNGGWDTLQVLQPAGGILYDALSQLRPTLKVAPGNLYSVAEGYGLHPTLGTFANLWSEGRLAAIFNLGYENMSRSHMDAEVAFARGVIDRKSATSSGFINRLGSQYSFSALQAVSVSGTDPAFSGGSYTAVQTSGLANYYFRHFGSDWTEGLLRQDQLYSQAGLQAADSEKPKQRESIDSVELAINASDAIRSAVSSASFVANYPDSNFGRSFKDADILFSSENLGTQIAYIRRIGFDTHSNQPSVFPGLLQELNSALHVFVQNMKAKGLWDNLIILFFSEFGRTNIENASQGTDHGGASTALLSGGLVNGGLFGELTLSDLKDNPWLPQRYYTVELYRQIVAKLGYDPDPVFGPSAGPSLSSIF